jgi:hypothetical protein
MAEPFSIANIQAALAERMFPTVTVWNRLEGRPRTLAFDRALGAEVRDALWLLAKQWQMGEFRGDDAGSPALSRLHLEHTRLTKYQAADHPPEPFEQDVPLEAKVERRPLPLAFGKREIAFDLRLLMGRHWLKLIDGIGDYADEFLAAYEIEAPDPTSAADADRVAHPEAWQTFAAVAGRRMDGGELYVHLKADSTNHAYDGVPVANADKPALDDAAERFVAAFDRLFYQGAGATDDAWLPKRLEYAFSASAPEREGEKVYVADEYYNGHLDWYTVDVRPRSELGEVEGETVGGLPATRTLGMIPTPVQFDGMPNTRWWSFEDGKTNFGDVDAATTDLAKLLFVEFGLVYANDWFVVPCTAPAGSVLTVRGLAVTNVFGERLWIEPAGSGLDDDWQRWSMFTVSVAGESDTQLADTSLLVPPTVPSMLEGDPNEEVYLVRDELANMVWGIETMVPLASGGTKPGGEAAAETLAFFRRDLERRLGEPAQPPPAAAAVRYRVMTSIPEQWIPFIPVHIEGDDRDIELQRAALPRTLAGDPDPPVKVRPRTVLMREGLDRVPQEPYLVNEQEATRAGVRITQSFQRVRWRDGRVILWLGVRKQTGRGPSSSGLAFDQLAVVPPRREP